MPRPDKTILDYLIIAVCPILIGLMAGSLAFFLLECAYVGEHEERAQWIVGCFVVAMVGIARISMELSKGRAIVYGMVITFEVLYVTQKLAPGSGFVVLLIIVIAWFGIHKLTWNCTFIDEQEEDVGRGLLEAEALEEMANEGEEENAARKPSQWRRWFSWKYLWELVAEPKDKRHPPGAWIVYFAVIAIPIFTLAQWMIPPEEQEAAMKYVTVYLLSAMGLLVATSLLGLRRYLRRRNAVMHKTMAVAWLTLGGILIVVCISLATILPRPTGTVSERLASMRESFTFKEQPTQASRNALGKDGAAENPDDYDEREGNNKGKGESDGKSSKSSRDGKPGSQDDGSQQSNSQGGGNNLTNFFAFLRWIILAIIVGLALFWAFKHRRELMAVLLDILESIRNFWANLFGFTKRREKREKKKQTKIVQGDVSRRRFLELVDPFTSGQADKMPPQELVKYTFEAIETWAIDRGAAREENETPCDFLNRVDRKTRVPTKSIKALSEAYSSTTYDTLPETPETRAALLDHLGTVWRSMKAIVSNV